MGRNRKHKIVWHFAAMPIEYPYTLDLKERAQIAMQVQQLIGGFVMGLLSNYKPLELVMSIQNTPALGKKQQSILAVHWRETEPDDNIHIFKGINFTASCLQCGQFHVEGECPTSNLVQSPDQSAKEEPSSETSQS